MARKRGASSTRTRRSSRHRELIAWTITVTVCVVLFVVVLDLTLASKLSATDRAASLAALGAIGLALATGIVRYLEAEHAADDVVDHEAGHDDADDLRS